MTLRLREALFCSHKGGINMFRIGDFSKLSKTSIKTLRYYDEIGLLRPEYVDSENGYRFYTTEQLLKIHKIHSFKQLGFGIKEIRDLINGVNVDNLLEQRKTELIEEQRELEKQLSKVKFLMSNKQEVQFMNYEATVKYTPTGIAYTKRMNLSGYEEYFKAIPALGIQMKELNPNMKCGSPEYCFIVHVGGEYKDTDMDIQFYEIVDKEGKAPDGVKYEKLESCKVISVMHKGKYQDLGLAYAFALKWTESNGYKVIGNIRENYIDGIWNKASEDDWLTEIQVPIE